MAPRASPPGYHGGGTVLARPIRLPEGALRLLYLLSVWLHILAAAAWLGRLNLLLGLVVVALGVMLVRGPP